MVDNIFRFAFFKYREKGYICPFDDKDCKICNIFNKQEENYRWMLAHIQDKREGLKMLIKVFPIQFLESEDID